ncbi:NAD-dependent epimerase/dehydratase family protein [Chitinophaga oryziterrae]|uniref:NAD-dependent epimerase/dehydratase family protein n=1 Tax=Chitinophaga oryziterrae TaxID=1031224 RepID=A0A6N8J9Z2_9BACT|nr:SDR family oxidoreductase [Chitinophaga oryziterrae]MVT42050.1 NAD-dependent epimerase/dehydratase family protein [Chitinophaga oryziterrae]
MRVFITGASGFIGSIITKSLIADGYQVLGLARSKASAQLLTELGAEVHWGNLEDLESLRSGAALSDGVIHTGFIHDFSRFKENCEVDRLAIEAMGTVLLGSDRPFIVSAGTGINDSGQIKTENDGTASRSPMTLRVSEETAASVAELGGKVAVVRLPPSVHGWEQQGLVTFLIAIAREKGVSAYVGEGLNRWPAVHHHDAARVFKLAIEKGVPDFRYHAVAEEGIPLRNIAEVIGQCLNLPVVSKTAEEAVEHFGWLAPIVSLNCPASSAITQERLGWYPNQPGLIDDLKSVLQFQANQV